MNTPKPLIFGISGTSVTDAEKRIYSKMPPLGFILFKKNLIDKEQASNLCAELRELVGRDDVPILVDQEGGSVNRLRTPIWRQPPSPLELGKFAYAPIENNVERTSKLVYLNAQLIAYEMQEIGINANCAPVSDLLIPGTHHITGTRSFGPNPILTSVLVNSMIEGLRSCGVQAIMKHMPGQGRANKDSHLSLPTVSEDLQILEANDFYVFRNAINAKWSMTAHIKYECIDAVEHVTYSKKVINYIRNVIGFRGTLISDCLTMKALPESLGVKATKTIEAGIDVVLYGGSSLEFYAEMAAGIPHMTANGIDKVRGEFAILGDMHNIAYESTLLEYEALLTSLEAESSLARECEWSDDYKFVLDIIGERNKEGADYSSPLYKA